MPSMLWQFAWEHDRFREVLALWLSALPADGWTGTIFQLQIALNNAARRRRSTRYSPRRTGNALGVRIRADRPFLRAQVYVTGVRPADNVHSSEITEPPPLIAY